ncbi:hypothetical protein CH330_07090 [candidate division WOR-3 bacterium JGI_Cruoil_03_51_56]|uniref:Secretion system C-terminal sorting domain-containing protein n=1 Tax=candidate division WOR-3 bacterium JGI_Cruoil_03_51_56 TaxID=1973747 RepID=A0A235BR48_UNCW3|nr:MAG: hypothetical protein CH330_07090 [candidate division WOR-3 bacterium JGI_Cruoil_03_51_56]
MRRRTVLVTIVLGTALAFANAPIIHPPAEIQDHPWLHIPDSPVTDLETAVRGTATPLETSETDYLKVSGHPGREQGKDELTEIPLGPFMDWGNDELVGTLSAAPTHGKLSTDVASNGDIYVGILKPEYPSGINDTVFVYRSTDGGHTWGTGWKYAILGVSSRGGIQDYQIRIGSDAHGTWIYDFVLYDGAGSGNGGVMVVRHRPILQNTHWTTIAPGDTFLKLAADRNIESPQHLFCAWETQGHKIRMMSSKDSSQTWGNLRSVCTGYRSAALCAGGAGYVYIGFASTTDSVKYVIGRYTNNLISPSIKFNTIDSSPNYRYRHISIAADRAGSGPSQTAIALVTGKYVPNGNIGPRYSWTTTGGVSWSYSFWPVTNQPRQTWDGKHPYIRRSYPNDLIRAVVTMPENTTSWDTLVYAFARPTSPTNWEGRAVPNDYRITGEYGGRVDYSSDIYGGGYITYRQYGDKKIYFDGWNWTGIEEETKVTTPTGECIATLFAKDAALRLNLNQRSRVKATLYDETGRIAHKVFNGTLNAGNHRLPICSKGLAQGIYFLNLNLNGKTETTKLVKLY